MTDHELTVFQATAVLAGILAPIVGAEDATIYAVNLANAGMLSPAKLAVALANVTGLEGAEILECVHAYSKVVRTMRQFAFMNDGIQAPAMSILDIAAPSLN